ncbi:hypothetical protein [Microtetraspora malaysiensis]
MPSPEERRELGDVPEGGPVAEVKASPRKHRKLIRGDQWELVFDDEQNA